MSAPLTPRHALARLIRSSEFQQLERVLSQRSAFHILGIQKRELSHAALLGWLLDPRGSHGMGAAPLRSFLMLTRSLACPNAPGPDAIDIDEMDLHSAQVQLEVGLTTPKTKTARRPDLIVTLPQGDKHRPILLVEYKVDASETNGQTIDYASWALSSKKEYDWPKPPALVYLSPVHSQPESPDFTVVDYDAYVPWLSGLIENGGSAQAVFLVREFIDCLSQRDDVTNDTQDELVQAVLHHESEAVSALRTVSVSKLPRLQAVVERHRLTLSALDLFQNTQSKGYSAFVSAFRAVLRDHLDDTTWTIRGGEGSLVCVYLPTTRALGALLQTKRSPTSSLRVQVFMERPKNGRAKAVVEVIGNHPTLEAHLSKALRRRLAHLLRNRVSEHFDQGPGTKGSATVGSYILSAPGINDVSQDTDAQVQGLHDQFAEYAQRIDALGNALATWVPVFEAEVREAMGMELEGV